MPTGIIHGLPRGVVLPVAVQEHHVSMPTGIIHGLPQPTYHPHTVLLYRFNAYRHYPWAATSSMRRDW